MTGIPNNNFSNFQTRVGDADIPRALDTYAAQASNGHIGGALLERARGGPGVLSTRSGDSRPASAPPPFTGYQGGRAIDSTIHTNNDAGVLVFMSSANMLFRGAPNAVNDSSVRADRVYRRLDDVAMPAPYDEILGPEVSMAAVNGAQTPVTAAPAAGEIYKVYLYLMRIQAPQLPSLFKFEYSILFNDEFDVPREYGIIRYRWGAPTNAKTDTPFHATIAGLVVDTAPGTNSLQDCYARVTGDAAAATPFTVRIEDQSSNLAGGTISLGLYAGNSPEALNVLNLARAMMAGQRISSGNPLDGERITSG